MKTDKLTVYAFSYNTVKNILHNFDLTSTVSKLDADECSRSVYLPWKTGQKKQWNYIMPSPCNTEYKRVFFVIPAKRTIVMRCL